MIKKKKKKSFLGKSSARKISTDAEDEGKKNRGQSLWIVSFVRNFEYDGYEFLIFFRSDRFVEEKKKFKHEGKTSDGFFFFLYVSFWGRSTGVRQRKALLGFENCISLSRGWVFSET